ncbi:MAG: hypothetical protein P8P49_12660 [Opitutales bacterium]|nr:hypothetical protein [Opitutales bacterium]
MKIAKLIITVLLASLLQANADQNVTKHAYKDLKSEISLINSYYLKAEQSSEIAQTRFERGLYSMSELSSLRAMGQFHRADDSIDSYISKVAAANIKDVMPWNKKRYKKQLLDQAMELRLMLAVQEEDLQALVTEVQKQLDQRQVASIGKTLERLDEFIRKLNLHKQSVPADKVADLEEAIAVLTGAKSAILEGVDQEADVSELVEVATSTMDNLQTSELLKPEGGPFHKENHSDISPERNFLDSNKKPKPNFGSEVYQKASVVPPEAVRGDSVSNSHKTKFPSLASNQKDSDGSALAGLSGGQVDKGQGVPSRKNGLVSESDGLRIFNDRNSAFSTIETSDGRKIRVSRPPQDWPNGKATGYDSVYDDRPGGNLIKEEEIVFERVHLPEGQYSVHQMKGSRKERKWNFNITESGGIDERYSIANLGNFNDFEIKSWVLRNHSKEIVDRLDGNNLHFSPLNFGEGDYSLEVEGVTGWSSPFKVVASILR